MAARRRIPAEKSHAFGGTWTEIKLEIIRKYLVEYLKVMKNQSFTTWYVDAFAGTGSRDAVGADAMPLFANLLDDEPRELLDGSARIALQTEPGFDHYLFIENNQKRVASLEALRQEFPSRSIDVSSADANQAIRTFCSGLRRGERAVMFVDPYGMQVEWATLEAVAKTRAIDLWILFPVGIGVNRLLANNAKIPASWRQRLDTLLGTPDWFEAFYRIVQQPSLLPGENETVFVKTASIDVIGRFFNDRLAGIFAEVASSPRVLSNSSGSPMYLLCFAVANPAGAPPALRIANHILKKMN